MKIFLSACDVGANKTMLRHEFVEKPGPVRMLWNLVSFQHVQNDVEWAETIRDLSELLMVDSGAHSFQKGARVCPEEHTHRYAAFIRSFDRENVVGYFEMDIDNIIGYEEVLRLRKLLERECGCPEKIIPVWHKNRGIDEFRKMCQTHKGRVVAITGFRNEDIRDEQYPAFLRYAWSCGCRVHCLGMTRRKVLDKVPFDYVDSSSWAQQALYGRVGSRKVSKAFQKESIENRDKVFLASYLDGRDMQQHYYRFWRKVNHD